MIRAKQGSILILVLWVVFALAALTVAVGRHVSSVMAVSERLWEITRTRALAESGARFALAQAMSQTNVWDGISDDCWNRNEELFSEHSLGDGEFSVGYIVIDDGGESVTNIGVIGESGRLNINKITEKPKLRLALEALVADLGSDSADSSREIVGKIVDSLGGDDGLTDTPNGGYGGKRLLRISSKGAEEATNKVVHAFKSVAELRRVDGVSDDLFRALLPYITVYGDGAVNLNCAPKAVLVALAAALDERKRKHAVYESLAGKIIAFRESGGVFDDYNAESIKRALVDDGNLAGSESQVWGRMVGPMITVSSSAFRGISRGRMTEGTEIKVEFVFDTASGKFLYWHETQ